MYTLKEIAALRQECNALELEGREILEKYSDEELQKICNGIGSSGMPPFLRRTMNTLHPTLQPVALIHDVEFEESDGSEKGFKNSNDRFLANGKRASAKYAWYDVRRYAVLSQAYRLAAFCRCFGGDSWQQAAEKNAAARSEGGKIYGTP